MLRKHTGTCVLIRSMAVCMRIRIRTLERSIGVNMDIHNFRDISGYRNRDDKVMKENRLFRGGALDRITPEQADYFENALAVRHILDLRDAKEAEMAKDYLFQKAEYERISALRVERHDKNGFDFEKIIKNSAGQESGMMMSAEMFQSILEYLKEGYRTMAFGNPAYQRLFTLLLQNDGNIYFHCTAGKDRTGVAGFLIMMALGMDEEDAVEEYLLSNQYLKQGMADLAGQLNIPEEYRQMCAPLLGVREEFIRLTIDAIRSKYTDYDAFFASEYGLDQAKRCRLVEIYCE